MTRRKLTESEFRKLVNRETPTVVRMMVKEGELNKTNPRHRLIINRWLKEEKEMCDDDDKKSGRLPVRKKPRPVREEGVEKSPRALRLEAVRKRLRRERLARKLRRESIMTKLRERRRLRAEADDDEISDEIPDATIPDELITPDVEEDSDEEKENNVNITVSMEARRAARRRKLKEALQRHREKRAGGDKNNPSKKLTEEKVNGGVKQLIVEGPKTGEPIMEWFQRTRKSDAADRAEKIPDYRNKIIERFKKEEK